MADVSHELGALRFVVESPLSSKVAMFNNQATQHKQSQLLNPFTHDGRATSPKPTFSKDQYGKPLTGSLTEMRGQKANMHVMKEMLELCQIISSEGYQVKDEPAMRVIPFGELFNIYNYISDKVVGLLLRARKHKLVDFEGEMLYQRRDDNVPIFLLRPVSDIRRELNEKIEEIKRGTSPAPQSTSVLLDKSAHEHNLKVQEEQRSLSKSRTPSPGVKSKAKSKSPVPAAAAAAKPDESTATVPVPVAPVAVTAAAPIVVIDQPTEAAAAAPPIELTPIPAAITEQVQPADDSQLAAVPAPLQAPEASNANAADATPIVAEVASTAAEATPIAAEATPIAAEATPIAAEATPIAVAPEAETIVPVQPVDGSSNELPTIIIEASATFVRTVSVEKPEEKLETAAAAESAAAESAAAESA